MQSPIYCWTCALLWRWTYAACRSLSVSFLETEAQHQPPISNPGGTIPLILLPDIPLAGLEERKSEHLRLLRERIGQLKQQMEGDRRPAGNIPEPRFGSAHVV